MNKSELIDAVAEAASLTKADAEKAINAVVDVVTAAVARGDKVTIPGFGAFSVSERSARTGRNPQTGASMEIAAARVPKFSAGSGFKTAVNHKGKP